MARTNPIQEILRGLLSEEGGSGPAQFRRFMDLFSPGLFGRIEQFEQRVRQEFARHEGGEPVTDPQAEALVDMLYGYVQSLKERNSQGQTGPLRNAFRKMSYQFVRNAVNEIELALLPQRAQAFELLGVRRTDSVNEIKTKFRSLAREHHPDKPSGDHRKMQELNRAYEIVMRMKGLA